MQFRSYDENPAPSLPAVVASRTIYGVITKGKWYDIHKKLEVQYEIIDDSGTKTCIHMSHFRELGQRLPDSTDKVELIITNKIASDGGATTYYDLPADAKTLYDLIDYRPQGPMNFSEGNVFKAVWRMGAKEGIDDLYDWRKIKFCAEREIARLEKLTVSEKKDV